MPAPEALAAGKQTHLVMALDYSGDTKSVGGSGKPWDVGRTLILHLALALASVTLDDSGRFTINREFCPYPFAHSSLYCNAGGGPLACYP